MHRRHPSTSSYHPALTWYRCDEREEERREREREKKERRERIDRERRRDSEWQRREYLYTDLLDVHQ